MNKKILGRPPAGGRVEAAAGTAPGPVGQQAVGADLGVIVANDRDLRTLDWLIAQVGPERIQDAIDKLGGRRPYVSNIAKILGLLPPEALSRVERETAVARLKKLRADFMRHR
jgi:hypothetical protein